MGSSHIEFSPYLYVPVCSSQTFRTVYLVSQQSILFLVPRWSLLMKLGLVVEPNCQAARGDKRVFIRLSHR